LRVPAKVFAASPGYRTKMSSTDPLLQPFQLKHLTLKNRIMTTSHEPAYPEDGMPKERYRAYHVERAKAGVALTMTAGSAAVSRDSPPVFNNVLAFKDEVVPWMRDLADACHEYGAAVMIQLTARFRRRSRIGTLRASSKTTPMRRSACMPRGWTASSCRPTVI